MNQERQPIEVLKMLPVGANFFSYVKDGMSKTWGRWSCEVMVVDSSREIITLRLSQDWEGADTRGGQCWSETRKIPFDKFIIPLLP